MVQKCSSLKVLEVFFTEPTTIHYIKSISRKINLAPTSVRNWIKSFLKEGLIKRKKAKPFNGFIANRENEDFIFYKRVYNLYSLKELVDFLTSEYYPKLLVVYGSYSFGLDVESSDIDILVLTKTKKDINLKKFEKKLERSIHLLVIDSLRKLNKSLLKKVYNGIVLHGGF
jgi:predicted nucleotidyltransferase